MFVPMTPTQYPPLVPTHSRSRSEPGPSPLLSFGNKPTAAPIKVSRVHFIREMEVIDHATHPGVRKRASAPKKMSAECPKCPIFPILPDPLLRFIRLSSIRRDTKRRGMSPLPAPVKNNMHVQICSVAAQVLILLVSGRAPNG